MGDMPTRSDTRAGGATLTSASGSFALTRAVIVPALPVVLRELSLNPPISRRG
jgi:hypothetical protein